MTREHTPAGSLQMRAEERRIMQAITAFAAVVLAYVPVYGPGIASSLTAAGGRGEVVEQVPISGFDMAANIIAVIWAAAGVVIALRVTRPKWAGLGQWVWAPERLPWATTLGAVGVVLAALTLGDGVIGPLVERAHLMNHLDYDPGIWPQVATALRAGIGEEIIVLAAPAAVLRFYRIPAAPAIIILVFLRLAYHLYYGWTGIWWLVPWAVVSAVVYWRWRDLRVLALLIVIHIIFDLRGVLFADHYRLVEAIAAVGVLVAAFAINPKWWAEASLKAQSVSLGRSSGLTRVARARAATRDQVRGEHASAGQTE